MTETFLTREQFALAIGRSTATVDVLIKRTIVKSRRHGRRVFVPQSEVEKFFKKDLRVIWVKHDGKTSRRLHAPDSPQQLEAVHA